MKKSKKKSKLFLVILFFILILIILIITSPLILVYSSPYITKKVFGRELKFESVNYSPLKASLDIRGLILSKEEGLTLFEIKRVNFSVDLKKLLMLKPVLTSVVIEGPKTFIEKYSENKYQFPEYFDIGKGEKKKDFKFNLPFSVEEIIIKEGSLDLKEKSKYKDLLKDVTVFVPGIKGHDSKKEIEPVVSGKFMGESFKIKGKSMINEQSLVNTFVINLKNFQLGGVSKYIPPIRNIKISSGTVTTNLNITFAAYKNKKPSLTIIGNIAVKNLNLHDVWINEVFLKNADGTIKVEKLDFANKILDISDIYLDKGRLILAYSDNDKERSTFFRKNKKSIYKTHIKNITGEDLQVLFDNRINKKRYIFDKIKIKTSNFYNFKTAQMNFSLSGAAEGIEGFNSEGFVSYKEKIANFKSISVFGLDLNKFGIIPHEMKTIKKGIIGKFDGSVEFSQNEIKLGGKGSIKELTVEINKKGHIIDINNAVIDIKEWFVNDKKFSVNSISCFDAGLLLSDRGQSFKKLKFFIPERKTSYNFSYDSKSKKISIKDDIKIHEIAGAYNSEESVFDFKLNKLRIQPDLKVNVDVEEKINGLLLLESDDLYLYDKGKPVFKIDKIQADIDSIKYKPLYINFNNLILDSPNFEMTIKKDKKLYVFSLFKLKAENSVKDIKLNIDKLTFNNGKIIFIDYSLDTPFSIEINKLNGEITNYPSTVYPEGDISINGIIGNRNAVKINSTISNELGIRGKLKSNDVLLPQFAPYTEKFINYSIADGVLDISSNYEINRDKVDISFDMVLKNARFVKKDAVMNGQNLTKIIPQLEDSDGKIKISMPSIKGKWDSPEFDFRSIFFDLFLDILSNTGKNIMPSFEKFKPDNTIDIIYFKAGSSEFLLSEEKIFSNNIIDAFKNKNKFFVIEGFADKDKDKAFLKEEILKEKMQDFSSSLPEKGSKDELSILKDIYFRLSGNNAPKDAANELLKSLILTEITVGDARYYALSYARMNKIKDVLINNYNIKSDRIGIIEKNIFSNPYIEGVGNSIAVLKSGTIRE